MAARPWQWEFEFWRSSGLRAGARKPPGTRAGSYLRWKVCRMARLPRGCLLLAVGCSLLVDLSEAVAQERPAARVTCNLGAAGGARRYRSGVWGMVEVFADNPTNEPVEAESIARFVDDPMLQYGRRVLVPANSFLRTTCPVRIPELPASQARAAYFMTEQVLPPPRVDGPQQTHQDAMLGSKLLLLDPETAGGRHDRRFRRFVPAGELCSVPHGRA